MTFYAGAAHRDITPTQPTALYGYPHVARISTGIHDPLLASVLFLHHDDVKLVMVALDLLFLDPPTSRKIRQRIAQQFNIPQECIFITCTHTHSGPVTRSAPFGVDPKTRPAPDPAYLLRVSDEILQATTNAVAAAVPAELAWTSANARGVGGNRLSADGVTDPDCGILALRDAKTKKIFSLSLIYGMHPTVMHEDSKLLSSDFPHYARLHLHENVGNNITVLYHSAPCGNQSPRHFVTGQTFAEAERLGRKLGAAANTSVQQIAESSWTSSPQLAGKLASVTLPRRELLTPKDAQARLAEYRSTFERLKTQGAPRPEVRTAECSVFGAEGAVTLAIAKASGEIDRVLKEYEPIEVQLLRIGDVDLAGIPGECFTEYGLAIKQRAQRRTYVASFVNGELRGYIVTPEAMAQGGYEATGAVFEPAAGQVMVDAVLALAKQLA